MKGKSLFAHKWFRITADILISALVISAIVFGVIKYTKPDTKFNSQLSRQQIQEALLQDYHQSTSNPEFKVTSLRQFFRVTGDVVLDHLARTKYFSNILTNKRVDTIGLATVACSTDSACGITNEGYQYPIPVNQSELKKLQIDVPKTRNPTIIIIDVRSEEEYLASHIPGAVNLPITQIVDTAFPIDRWATMIVVGNTYEETRIASEALYKLCFHYIYRFQYPYQYWDGEKETFLANGE